MNRTKHMKHKKNTRRRHKSRNKTRKTRKPYKRCRTRSQRGGTTKEELLKEILAQYKGLIIPIPSYFINDVTFTNFLILYGELDLQRVVCGNYSEEDIRLHETQYLTKIKQILEPKPDPKTQFLNDLFLNRNFTQNWTDFVINLKKTVDTRYSVDLNLKKRMEALKEDPLHKLNEELVSPPSHRARPVPAAQSRPAAAIPAIPAHVQQPEPGPSLPEGWTRYGPDHAPFYTNNLTGKSQNEFPTMPAALEERLAQINNLDYISQKLSPEDNRHAKESGAYLPDIPIPLLKERLAAAAKND